MVNYIFVFGKFGCPEFGIAGFGYGFTFVFSMAALCIGFFLCWSKTCRSYNLFSNLGKLHSKYFLEILLVGSPIGMMYDIEVSAILIITLFMAHFGADALAAHQIARQYFSFFLMILFGMSGATTVRVGYAVGSNNKPAISRSTYTDIGIALFLTSIVAVLLTGFTKSFIGVDININDSNFASLISYTTSFLNILAVLFIFEGMRIICLAALRGLKDTRIPMFISFIGFWGIAVPVSYLLAFTLHFGGMGLCLGLTIGITANALILLIRFRKLVRKTDLKKLVA